jgi:Bacterial Ig-like domain (group 3)
MSPTNGIAGKAIRKVLVAGLGVTMATAIAMPNASAAGDDDLQAGAMGQAAATQAALLPDLSLKRNLLASATADECFNGVGNAYPDLKFDIDGKPYCDTGQLKVNQAYVWGLAQSEDTLWFGTGSNINCLATAQFMAPMTSLTDSYVCEGTVAKHLTDPVFATIKTDLETKGLTSEQALAVIGGLGDWRAPDLFTYDLQADKLTNINTDVTGDGAELLKRTVGIRSAGAIGDFVIFAGPDAASSPTGSFGAVNFFVFEKGQYLGAESVDGLTNIRKWVAFDGDLYTGVATAPIQGETTRGEVLKFTGATAQDPMQFEVVGKMTTAPSEFTVLNDHMYTTTWPVGLKSAPAGVWMSPAVGVDGLDTSDAQGWTEKWNVADYEPDPVIQASTAVGAIEALDGHLFWGTMNVPFVGAFSHGALYNAKYGHLPNQQEIILMLLGGHRAISVFRADPFDGPSSVELLYGNARLPVAEYANTPPVSGASPVTWRLKRNEMGGQAPVYGPAGFGNPFNAYTWTMAVNDGELYVGTFDSSYLISAMLRESNQSKTNAMLTPQTLKGMLEAMGLDGSNFPLQYGADLWRFSDADSAAMPEFINGADNRYSYGVRTLLSDGDNGLYAGMANPMNLEVNPAGEPQGGWQLVKLSKWRTQVGLNVTPNPAVPGEIVQINAGVKSENGPARGTIAILDGALTVGSCSVNPLKNTCTWFVPGFTAGSHELTAVFSDGRLWADDTSAPVTLVVAAPKAPAAAAEPQAPQAPAVAGPVAQAAPAASLQVSARSADKAVKSLKVTKLLQSSPAVVSVQCTVNGKVRTGKAARKACGLSVVVAGGAVKVAAKPKRGASQVSVTLTAEGGAWTRAWAVTPRA